MPVILVQIDATDNASSGLTKVAGNLNTLDQRMGRLATSSASFQRALDQTAKSYQSLDTAQARLQSSFTNQESAANKAARALDQYRAAQTTLASGAGDLAGNLDRVDRTFNAVIRTQDNAARATQRVADSYRSLATAQDNAARAQEKLNAEMGREPHTSGGGDTSGAHGGIPGVGGVAGLVRGVATGAAYTAGYYALSAGGQAFGNSLAYGRQLGTTEATTGMTPDQFTAMQQFIQQQASGGTQPYDRLTLAQGAYPISSVGVNDPTSMQAILTAAIKGSAASGATDVATGADALVTTMHAMGIRQQDMGSRAMGVEDILMTAANRGKVDPTQIPGGFERFVGLAANKNMSITDAAGLFTADTLTSPSALQSGQNMASLLRAVTAPSQGQLRAASMIPGASDLLGPDVFKRMDVSQWLTQLEKVTAGHEGSALPRLLGQADASNLVLNAIGPGGSKLQNTLGILQQEKQGGSTQNAFGIYEQSPAAKFDNATARFKTAAETLATAAIPLATAMTDFTTNGIQAIMSILHQSLPGVPTNVGSVVEGSARTLVNGVLNGGDWDAARHQSAADLQANARNRRPDLRLPGGNTVGVGGGLFDLDPSIAGFLAQHVPGFSQAGVGGHATASALPSGITASHGGFEDSRTGRWYQTLGEMQSGANQAGRVPGAVPSPIDDEERRHNNAQNTATLANRQLAMLAGGSAVNPRASGAAGTDWAAFDAYYASPNRPRGGPPATGVGGAFAGLAQGVYGTARGDYFANSLGGASQGIYDQAQGLGIAADGPNALRGGSGAAGGAAAAALARKLEGDQLALTASQQNLDAARMMGATPDALNRVNHEYLDAQRQLARDTRTGPALTSALRGLDKQQAGGDYQTQQADLQRRERDLQNRVQMDQLSGNAGAQAKDQKALTSLMRANAGMLGLDASDLALQSAQDKAALLARTTPNPAPFRANQAGFGAFGGGEGTVSVRVGGGVDPQLEEIRRLREENARLQHQVIDLLAGIKANTATGRQAAQGSLLSHTGSNHGYKG